MPNPERHDLMVPGGRVCVLSWLPESTPRARILLTHGHGEFAMRYDHVAAAFVEAGYSFHSYDLRGHGESSGRRGDARSYADLIADLIAVRTHLGEGKWFHYGHSFGAQILLRTLLEKPFYAEGIIISAPWLGLTFRPAFWKLLVAKLALIVTPGLRFTTGIDRSLLSRDSQFVEKTRGILGREVAHRLMSARLFAAGCAAANEVLERAPELELPMLIIQGQEDILTSLDRTKAFAGSLTVKDRTLQIYPGMRHEPHNELGRDGVIQDLITWVEART